jgi:sugar phosphate isomerase/epimerase
MLLCLSSRMFTVPDQQDKFELQVDAFIQLAKSLGYDGVTLRAGQLDAGTSPQQIKWIGNLLKQKRMFFSFVMGGPLIDAKSYESSCRLVEHAVSLECQHVQVSIPSPSGIPWLQRLCDFAADREIRISPQVHGNSIHDTVSNCLDLVKKVNRENFGFNFEPAQLLIQKAEPRGEKAVRALSGHIFTVCIQNYKLEGTKVIPCLPGDPQGVNFEDLFAALKEIGFNGFVTHISVRYPDVDNLEVCRAFLKYLRPLMSLGD